MSECRILVVGDRIFFTSVAALLARSEISELECFAAEDAIHALIKIHELRPHLVVADTAKANLWGVRFVPFVRRCFPELSLVAIGEAARPWNSGPEIDLLFQEEGEAARLRAAIEELVRRRPDGIALDD